MPHEGLLTRRQLRPGSMYSIIHRPLMGGARISPSVMDIPVSIVPIREVSSFQRVVCTGFNGVGT